MEYVSRVFGALTKVYGDGREGLIVHAIVRANTGHVDFRTDDPEILAPDAAVHDEVRRPISVNRLAQSLGLPFETTRQCVNRLIKAGTCVRVEGGVIVPKEAVQRTEVTAALLANVEVMRRLMRDLQAMGLTIEPPDPPGEATGD
jgi:hypothetical protein